MEIIAAYFYSLVVYSCFQFFDLRSTKSALSGLELEKHEINPLLVFLNKRVGFESSSLIMWLLIANLIAAYDAFYVNSIFGIPLACFFFGMFHLLAVFNNLEIQFSKQFVGAEAFERNTDLLIEELQKRSAWGKITLLIRLNLFSVFLSAFGIAALFLSLRLLSVLQIKIVTPVSYALVYFPPMMILALILFFPIKVFGMFIICRRRLNTARSTDEQQESAPPSIRLDVNVLETALNEAKSNNAQYIQFDLKNPQERAK
jgi:hypothetical protein